MKGGEYPAFCSDLRRPADAGARAELEELVRYFKETYKARPSLMASLRAIKIE